MAAGVSPPGAAESRKRRLAASRTSAYRVSSPRSRKRPKSSPGARLPEARVHSRPSVIRLEMAVPAGNGAAANSEPAVSRTKALRRIGDEERGVVGLLTGRVGDATLPAVLEQAGHDVDRLGGGAGPLEAEADEVHADQGRLAPPRVVGRADRSLPMATPCSLTPCSAPHSQVGQERKVACGAGVPDREVLGAQGAAGRGPTTEGPGDLDLAGWAVRVLGEHHAAGTGSTQGVAHDRSVGSD